MKLRIALVSMIGFVAGCGSSPQEKAVAVAEKREKEAVERFEHANKLLDEQQYEMAAKELDKLRVDKPATMFDYLVLYNSAIAYQALGQCEIAGERYRQTIRLTAKRAPKIQAMARLRLSDVYICIGDDKKAMVNLIELYRNRKSLPKEIGEAEIPARLAAAYARDGNKTMAEKYFKFAEMGLSQIRLDAEARKDGREMMAKTLFLMGNLSQLNPENMSSSDYFTTIQSLQKYLYRAVELNVKNWSEQAAQQLTMAYDRTWQYLDSVTPLKHEEDKGRAKRDLKQQKVRIARRALTALRALYDERVPSPNESASVLELLSQMKRQETKLQNFIAVNRPGNELTPEGEKTESVKREGRVYKPDPQLEMKNK